jgi:hypothetical protein
MPKEEYTPNKFIVINREHLRRAPSILYQGLITALRKMEPFLPNHTYHVCNADEPYGDKVIDMILEGEAAKKADLEVDVVDFSPDDNLDEEIDKADPPVTDEAEEDDSIDESDPTEPQDPDETPAAQ